jgi:hypothetical protein
LTCFKKKSFWIVARKAEHGYSLVSYRLYTFSDNKFDQSYSFTEGKSLDLTCPVSNVLKSSVQWFKDGVLFDENRMLLDVGETKDGRLQLSSLQLSDRGYYTCTAPWNIGKKSFSTLEPFSLFPMGSFTNNSFSGYLRS